MNQKALQNISFCFAGLTACFGMFALFLVLFCGSDLSKRTVASTKRILPANPFMQKKQSYESIKEPILALQYSPPKIRLPDLRSLLVYYGKNGRPDANEESMKLHFAFNGIKATHSVASGEKVYLTFDKKMSPCKYNFSANNEETNLWFEARPETQGSTLCLFMKNENGELIQEPSNYAEFLLPEKEFVRFGTAGQTWEIGKWRVDGTLLARQKARWMGLDLFLEKHGGDEFSDVVGKQKINFEEADDSYSVFVKAGDCLIWDENRWVVKQPGDESLGHPLMCVKKVDERIMNFELWDVEGKAKVSLNLIRNHDTTPVQHLAQEFKFVGARTRTQCVFQVNQTRMMVKPNDWLLLTETGWKKLNTLEEIDDYVNCRVTGTLFVLDDIVRKDEKSHLVGTVFNPTRTDMQVVEIAMQPSSHLPSLRDQMANPQNDHRMQAFQKGQNYLNGNIGKGMSANPSALNYSNINPLANQ